MDTEELKKRAGELANLLSQKRCKGCADILVVDDNEFNRYLLVQLLNKHGFACAIVWFFCLNAISIGNKWKGSSRGVS